MPPSPPSPAVPGAVLTRPPPWAAVGVILLNDRLIKVRWPGWWSGKLSDFALCFLLPVALVAGLEWLRFATRRPWRVGPLGAGLACVATGAAFTALQLSPAASGLFVGALSAVSGARHFANTPDPTDRAPHDAGRVALAGPGPVEQSCRQQGASTVTRLRALYSLSSLVIVGAVLVGDSACYECAEYEAFTYTYGYQVTCTDEGAEPVAREEGQVTATLTQQ